MNLKKLEQYIFYLLVFLIPCNLAKHWPQPWSYVHGILVDYLIPTLYLTDILILILLGMWGIENNLEFRIMNYELNLKSRIKKNKKIIFWFIIFLLFTVYSLLFAKNPSAAVYKWLKFAEMGLLIYYIKRHINIKKSIKNIALVLGLSVIWQSLLAICQWFKQGSIFGYLFFGEQPFNSAALGIKKIDFFGQVKVLPMGTFPHPNVLAGFLVISLFLLLPRLFSRFFSRHPSFIPPLIISYYNRDRWSIMKWIALFFRLTLILGLLLGIVSLFLTFSLPAWIALVIGYSLFKIQRLKIKMQNCRVKFKDRSILLFALCSLLFALVILSGLKTADPESILRRLKLMEISLKMWLTSPLFGVGLNNFIPKMEEFGSVPANYRFLQPVHNIPLLVLSETGIVGEISLIWLIWLIIKKLLREKNYCLLITVYCLLFLSLFDHYFLTLQQGMLVVSLVVGLIL